MDKTINPETRRPYTITMIERLLHDVHFAVDPNLTSKEQALKVIKKLMEHFPIKRAALRMRFTAPKSKFAEQIEEWNANVISKDESGSQPSVVSLKSCFAQDIIVEPTML
uniref:Ribosome maturation protein SDO1/SBDS central domain-containing protein n=1 Tax=Leersia perrieri TaxID=77586 RepID=A0A0D9X3L1_9ORYZ